MFKKLNKIATLIMVCISVAFSASAATNSPKKKQAPVKQMSELDQLRMKMRSNVDEIEGTKWIYDKATPRYFQKSNCYVYLGQSDHSTWGRFILGFKAERWVFTNSIIMNIDGERIEVPDISYSSFTRDNGYEGVWEFVDVPLNGIYRPLAERIAASKKTLIRFKGKDRTFDISVSQKQKDSLKRMIRLHDLFNNPSA